MIVGGVNAEGDIGSAGETGAPAGVQAAGRNSQASPGRDHRVQFVVTVRLRPLSAYLEY
ncbi:hypothetical protein [Amycolatopsis sp. MJM2582]|uniref:hypothetical protein n=1 Tax=Amycolatopsis sp. MJM2582 TaxID=1427749 RepID=UPI0013788263|nr:hypothetical protein [Amycolatopsis sp. MJM2582]